jgi:hypothetical protein
LMWQNRVVARVAAMQARLYIGETFRVRAAHDRDGTKSLCEEKPRPGGQ